MAVFEIFANVIVAVTVAVGLGFVVNEAPRKPKPVEPAADWLSEPTVQLDIVAEGRR